MEQSGSSTRYIFGYFIIRRDIIIKNTTKNEYNKRKREYIKKIDEYNKKPNICLFCGSPLIAGYEVKLSEIKKRKFCSSSCAAKYNNIGKIKNPTGKGLKHSSSIINSFSDKEILDVFNSSNNISDFSKKLGYKTKISRDNKAVNIRLEKLGLSLDSLKKEDVDIISKTKGDLFIRSKNWQVARGAIAKLARKIYSESSKPKQCICCGYNKHFEVAHIKAVSDFDDDALISEINDINNLVALCPNHHWEYDNTDFDISEFLDMAS